MPLETIPVSSHFSSRTLTKDNQEALMRPLQHITVALVYVLIPFYTC